MTENAGGATPPPTGPGGLSAEQRDALDHARARLAPVRRARRLASVNAWTLAIFAGLTLLFGLGDPFNMLVGVLLGGAAWNEFQGRAGLDALEPAGARRLGWNQIVILGIVVLYCGVAFWKARYGPINAQYAELEELAGFEEGWISDLTATAYLIVAVAVAGIQLLTARFHFAREAVLRAHAAETPAWVREVLAEG